MRPSFFILFAAVTGGAIAAACGGGGIGPGPDDDGGFAADGGDANDPLNTNKQVVSVTVDPPTAAIEIVDNKIVTQAFKAIVHYADNTMETLGANVAWSATNPQIGSIDGAGLYTPSADIGGVVTVTAAYKTVKGTAQLTVKLKYLQNPANLGPNEQNALRNASTADAKVTWLYPYDKTVFPRGLNAPPLEWNGGAVADVYYVHVESPTYELEVFDKVPPPSRFPFADADWRKFVDSTSGGAKLRVARWDGQAASVVAAHTWTIAPQSMRGTIYYWANNTGRIMRVSPGAKTPDDFSAGKVPAGSCTMMCHTVSADGSTLVTAGGTFGGSWDLKQNAALFGLGGAPDSNQIRQWGFAATSPDGKYLVPGALMNQLTTYPSNTMVRAADGTTVANSGIPSERMYMPAFSPDGTSLVYVTGTNPSACWDSTGTPGTLRALDYNAKANPMLSNPRDVVLPGSNPAQNVISWPSVSPDGKWVTYSRLAWSAPAGCNLTSYDPIAGDLYIAELGSGKEARLAKLDGDGYPFGAGARDLHRNFEPTFAPVAAGGYFWVVLHSRRTYGNELVGAPAAVKQLWIAAIDQNPVAGQDPSHPPFRVLGQDINTMNLRGYFALEPCKGDGQGCTSGTECCGGYCDKPPPDAGGPVCKSTKNGCADNGDKCDVSADCCNFSTGVTCINHVCSEAPPK